VKGAAVVAVEAMEGTMNDCAGGTPAGPGARIVKVPSRTRTCGSTSRSSPRHIEAMRAAGATALSVDAGRALLLDGDDRDPPGGCGRDLHRGRAREAQPGGRHE